MGSQRIGHDRVAEHKLHTVYFCTGTFWAVPNHCVSFLCPQEPIIAALGSVSLLLTMLSLKVNVLVTQSCPILWDPMDRGLSGFSLHWISQARILVWVVISYSRGSSSLRDQTQVFCISCIGRLFFFFFKPLSHFESPVNRSVCL